MDNQFAQAINQICDEKRIDADVVIGAIESAMVAAFRKDHGHDGEEYEGYMDKVTGLININRIQHVVDEVVDPSSIIEAQREIKEKADEAREKQESGEELEKDLLQALVDEEAIPEEKPLALESQITLEDALKIKDDAKIGGVIKTDVTPANYGRIAAQTAKQVIMQRVREAERESLYSVYKDKEGEILNASVQRIEANGNAYLEVEKNLMMLHRREQIPGETYRNGQRLKVLISSVERTSRGPEVIITRNAGQLVLRLLEMEVPEITEGSVEVVNIAREAGIRTKIAVRAIENGVDPVGSCVGQKGIRIQNITDELNDERIDIIQYEDDIIKYLINGLSPAKIITIELNEKEKRAKVYVTVDQRSLAIGKNGQNVRLASKLLGWEIDILDWTPQTGGEKLNEVGEDAEIAESKAAEKEAAPAAEKEAAPEAAPEEVVEEAAPEVAAEEVVEEVAPKATPEEEKAA